MRLAPGFLTGWVLPARQHRAGHPGGGGNFLTVQAAVDAAANNDIIEIRAGVYDVFVCSKPLAIRGEPGVVLVDAFAYLTISGIGANDMFSLSQVELRVGPFGGVEPFIDVLNCSGLVLLDDIRPERGTQPPRITANQVRGLLVSDSWIGPLRMTGCSGSFTNCAVDSTQSVTAGAIVRLIGSTMDMTDGSLQIRLPNGGAGFEVVDSDLSLRVVNGLGLITVPSPNGSQVVEFDIRGASTVRVHPSVTPSNPTVLGGPLFRIADMTSVRATPAGPGGAISIDLVNTGASTAVWLFLSDPVTPYSLPGVAGDLFVGNSGAFIINLGLFTQFPGRVTVRVSVPPLASLMGQPVVAQGLDSSFTMSNADGFTLR